MSKVYVIVFDDNDYDSVENSDVVYASLNKSKAEEKLVLLNDLLKRAIDMKATYGAVSYNLWELEIDAENLVSDRLQYYEESIDERQNLLENIEKQELILMNDMGNYEKEYQFPLSTNNYHDKYQFVYYDEDEGKWVYDYPKDEKPKAPFLLYRKPIKIWRILKLQDKRYYKVIEGKDKE